MTGKRGQREKGEDKRPQVGLEPKPAALSHMGTHSMHWAKPGSKTTDF